MDRKEPSLFTDEPMEPTKQNDLQDIEQLKADENTDAVTQNKDSDIHLQHDSSTATDSSTKDSEDNTAATGLALSKLPIDSESKANFRTSTNASDINNDDLELSNKYKSEKSKGNSIIFILAIFLGVAFIGLISLAFWQWENAQKNAIQIEKLNKVLNQVSEDISFVNKDSDDKATSLKQSLTALNASVKSLTSDMKKQKSITGAHYKKITNLNKSVDGLQADLAAAKNDLTAMNSNLQVQIKQLAQTDTGLSKQIRGIELNLGELSLAVEALNNKLNKISIKDINELQSAKGELEQDIKSLKITTNRLTRQVEALLKRSQ